MKVFIGSDHAGFLAKKEVISVLESLGCEVTDVGPSNEDSVDYPIYARKVCEGVLGEEGSRGILICGSGTGMAIAANKFKGIRACFSYDEYSARMGRIDNNCNVLTLRSREFDHSKYEGIVGAFIEAEFAGAERHHRRVNELTQIEDSQ